jgi:hypothetical protein
MPTTLCRLLVAVILLSVPFTTEPTLARNASLLVVVVNDSTVTNVSSAELRKVFLRNSDTVAGHKMVPLNLPAKTETRVLFDKLVLGMSDSEVGRYWVDRRIRGESGPPTTVPSSGLLLRVVASLPHSIAYIREDEVTGSVRVVTVDGKSIHDPDYPLT